MARRQQHRYEDEEVIYGPQRQESVLETAARLTPAFTVLLGLVTMVYMGNIVRDIQEHNNSTFAHPELRTKELLLEQKLVANGRIAQVVQDQNIENFSEILTAIDRLERKIDSRLPTSVAQVTYE